MAKAAVRSKAEVLLLSIYCLMYFPLFVGVLRLYLFCYALLCVHSSFEIILKRKRKLVALLLSYICIVTILWLLVYGSSSRILSYQGLRLSNLCRKVDTMKPSLVKMFLTVRRVICSV